MKRVLLARPDLTAPLPAVVVFLLATGGTVTCALLLAFGLVTICWVGWFGAASMASGAAMSAGLQGSLRTGRSRPSVVGLVLASIVLGAWAAWCHFGPR